MINSSKYNFPESHTHPTKQGFIALSSNKRYATNCIPTVYEWCHYHRGLLHHMGPFFWWSFKIGPPGSPCQLFYFALMQNRIHDHLVNRQIKPWIQLFFFFSTFYVTSWGVQGQYAYCSIIITIDKIVQFVLVNIHYPLHAPPPQETSFCY